MRTATCSWFAESPCRSSRTVALLALLTDLATGLGALPFLAARRPTRAWIARANAAASGFMLAASVALFAQGVSRDAVQTVIGGLLVPGC